METEFPRNGMHRRKDLLVTFNIIITHIFPENFMEIPQIVWLI